MVQVIKAEEAIKTGDIVLVDINGKEIAPSEAANYFLVVDGQHRTVAASLYNEWARDNKQNEIVVPAIIVELQDETIAEYIMILISPRRMGYSRLCAWCSQHQSRE